MIDKSDECVHCTLRGNIEACMAQPCSKHDHWWGQEIILHVATLRESLAAYVAVCGNTASAPMTRETAAELYAQATGALKLTHAPKESLALDLLEFYRAQRSMDTNETETRQGCTIKDILHTTERFLAITDKLDKLKL